MEILLGCIFVYVVGYALLKGDQLYTKAVKESKEHVGKVHTDRYR